MRRIEFDRQGLGYVFKLSAIVGVLLLVGVVVREELTSYLSEHPENAPSFVPVSLAEKPAIQKLSDDAVLFSNHDALLKKRDELARQEKSFLFADLEHMQISFYEGGVATRTYPIVKTGKEGSFYETPSGMYKIESRETNHYSRLSKVWMPWSMHFFGNYFIHGRPYYPDGSLLTGDYSGGCIQLEQDQAKELFGFVKTGMPVLVASHKSNEVASFSYFKKTDLPGQTPARPQLNAVSAIAVDFDTGQVLFEKNKESVFPIASVSKLMTGLVSLEVIGRLTDVTVTRSALDEYGQVSGLSVGEVFKSQDLLYPLILPSSNDVAKVYEDQVAGFVDLMNKKARAIGMDHTSFTDASGLSQENVSTAADLFHLLRAVYEEREPLFKITGLRQYTYTPRDGRSNPHTWVNINWPRDDDRFIGGKAGFTYEALQTMAGVYKVKLGEGEERRIAVIVLGTHTRIPDVNNIIKYLENSFIYGSVLTDSATPAQTVVPGGAGIYEAVKQSKLP